MNAKLAISILIGCTGYIAWAVMAWYDPAQRNGFLIFNISMATGTIGLALRDMQPATPPKELPK
ncbi:MAG: hypothetical protein ACYC4K_09020 [Thiobacillus sp.]